jgi:hypothetical protein
MKKLFVLFMNFSLLALHSMVWAAEPGEKIVDFGTHRVPIEGLGFINAWFAYWYNENKIVFAIIVTVTMGVIGGIIAFVTDIILKIIGMEVSKIEHHE